MQQANILRVFVASPGDVMQEREILQEVANDLNNHLGRKAGVTIQLLNWRDHVTPYLEKAPEPTILQQVPVETWDTFIGVMWSRFGTPTGSTNPESGQPFLSGTEEEFTLAFRCNQEKGTPKILFYRCMRPVKPDVDSNQLKLVQDFFRQFEYQGKFFGLYTQYETLDDFRRTVSGHLTDVIFDLLYQDKEPSKGIKVIDKFLIHMEKGVEAIDITAKLERYRTYRDEIDQTQEYEFEEILWRDLSDDLHKLEDQGYSAYEERSEWLRKHSFYVKVEKHLRLMLERFKDQRIAISKTLGFSLLRQGKLSNAIAVFEAGRSLAKEDDLQTLADFENLLGQANHLAGKWDKSLEHYSRSARVFILNKNWSGLAGVYINRAFVHVLLGLHSSAIKECKKALELLSTLPMEERNTQRRQMYAQMNLGTAYRYASEFELATQYYRECYELAFDSDDQEILCYALQQLGINASLKGKKTRQDRKDLLSATQSQLEAWKSLNQAILIAREANWRPALADGLSRLARVYEELFRLTVLYSRLDQPATEFSQVIFELQDVARTFQVPELGEYRYKLLMNQGFEQLGWLEKSAQLFELSALMADEIHRALNSWTRLAELLLELKNYDLVPRAILEIERLKGLDYQGELFSALGNATLADLDFEQERFDSALERYAGAFGVVAKHSRHDSPVLSDRLLNLERRIRTLSPVRVFRWCDFLLEYWLSLSIATVRPELLRFIETIRYDTVLHQQAE